VASILSRGADEETNILLERSQPNTNGAGCILGSRSALAPKLMAIATRQDQEGNQSAGDSKREPSMHLGLSSIRTSENAPHVIVMNNLHKQLTERRMRCMVSARCWGLRFCGKTRLDGFFQRHKGRGPNG